MCHAREKMDPLEPAWIQGETISQSEIERGYPGVLAYRAA